MRTAVQRAGDLEVFVEADCRADGAVTGDCDHPAAYSCHLARAEVVARRLNVAAARKRVAAALARLRKEPTKELEWLSILGPDSGEESALSTLAVRVLREREDEDD
jgi:hypothetical protein